MIGLLFRVDERIGLNNESSNEKACVYTAQHKSVNHMNHPDGLFWTFLDSMFFSLVLLYVGVKEGIGLWSHVSVRV